jgi:hypothetical protein
MQKSFYVYDNNIVNNEIKRDVRIQGIDAYLTKIQESRGGGDLNTTRQWEDQRKVSSRPR